MGQGGELAQVEAVVAGDAVVLADRGEDLGLFDGVHTQVGLQVKAHVKQIGGVSGELGDDADHDVGDLVTGRCRRRRCLGGRLGRCGGCGRRGRCGGRFGGRGGDPGFVADPADGMGQGGELAQVEAVVAGDAVVLADRGEDLGLFDGVHTQVGLQVKAHVKQIGGVSGELGDDADHDVGDLVTGRCRRRRRRLGGRLGRCGGCGRRGRCGGRFGGRGGDPGFVADPADGMGQGGELAQVEAVVAGDAVVLADRGEDLGLFDGVHTQVGLQVKAHVKQVGGVSGELGDDADHDVGDLVTGRCRRRRAGPALGPLRRVRAPRPVRGPLRRPGRGSRLCRGPSRWHGSGWGTRAG